MNKESVQAKFPIRGTSGHQHARRIIVSAKSVCGVDELQLAASSNRELLWRLEKISASVRGQRIALRTADRVTASVQSSEKQP